jgi:hypothetical protein
MWVGEIDDLEHLWAPESAELRGLHPFMFMTRERSEWDQEPLISALACAEPTTTS